MDFEFQVKLFTDQLVELLEQAKVQASLDFTSERSNWEQHERQLRADITHFQNQAEIAGALAQEWEQKYLTLQSKLSALV